MYTLTLDASRDLREQLGALGRAAHTRLVIDGRPTPAKARRIAAAPVYDIEELHAARLDDDPDALDDEVTAALLAGPWRSLRLVDFTHNPCGPATIRALAQLPALEDVRLALASTRDDIAALVDSPVAARLVRLDISNTGVGDAGIHAIARARLDRLRVLRLSTTSASMDALAALATSEHLGGLDELTYGWPCAGTQLVDAIAGPRSRLQLRRLELSTVRLADGSVQRLVAAMPALEQLRLFVCTVDTAAIDALLALPALRDVRMLGCILDDQARTATARLGDRLRVS